MNDIERNVISDKLEMEISDVELIESMQQEDNPGGEVEAKQQPSLKVESKLKKFFSPKSQTSVSSHIIPIKVIIGFLPEVLEQDALEYSIGIAEKYFDQMGIAYFDAYPYANGYAFEIHEGGAGRAYLPEIIKYFESQGEYKAEDPPSVVIKTSTRNVEVQALREGLTSIVLSEDSTKRPTEWLCATEKMHPALHKRTGFLIIGAAIFVTGFVAMIASSMLTRYTPYTPAPEAKVEVINVAQYPKGQWPQLEQIMAKEGAVKALRFRNNKWEQPELWPTTDDLVTDTAESPNVEKR